MYIYIRNKNVTQKECCILIGRFFPDTGSEFFYLTSYLDPQHCFFFFLQVWFKSAEHRWWGHSYLMRWLLKTSGTWIKILKDKLVLVAIVCGLVCGRDLSNFFNCKFSE